MTITKIKTVLCAECSKSPWLKPEQSQTRQILHAEALGGERIAIVKVCQHCTVLEVFDIENHLEDLEPASPS